MNRSEIDNLHVVLDLLEEAIEKIPEDMTDDAANPIFHLLQNAHAAITKEMSEHIVKRAREEWKNRPMQG